MWIATCSYHLSLPPEVLYSSLVTAGEVALQTALVLPRQKHKIRTDDVSLL